MKTETNKIVKLQTITFIGHKDILKFQHGYALTLYCAQGSSIEKEKRSETVHIGIVDEMR